MSHHTESLLVFLSTVAGGAASSLAVCWAIYTHRKSESEKKALTEAAQSKTLADLQVKSVIAEAVTQATAPLQQAIIENTRITQGIDLRLTRVETVQFGGNGGGFREELNRNSVMTQQVVDKLATMESDINDLKATHA